VNLLLLMISACKNLIFCLVQDILFARKDGHVCT
jgi:hypothetical protein